MYYPYVTPPNISGLRHTRGRNSALTPKITQAILAALIKSADPGRFPRIMPRSIIGIHTANNGTSLGDSANPRGIPRCIIRR